MVSAWPISDRICFTASALAASSVGITAAWCPGPCRPTAGLRPISALLPRLVGDLIGFDTPLPGNLAGRHQRTQPMHCGAYHVVRIGGSQTLGEDVGNPGTLEHRPHRSTGDHAGSG